MTELTLQEREKQERLKKLHEQEKLLSFRNTATPTTAPIRVLQLWRFHRSKIIVLGSDYNLYFITGNKKFKLKELEQPLDKGWSLHEMAELSAKRIITADDKFRKIAMDDAKAINIFERTAKKLGKTPEEIFETEETFKQFMKDIHTLATTH